MGKNFNLHRAVSFSALVVACLFLAFRAEAADPAFIHFDNTKFFLKFAPQNSPVQLREYLPKGETLEKWVRMLSSRRIEGLNDPVAYAHGISEHVDQSDPNAKSRIYQNEKSGQIIVDFLVFSPEDKGPAFAEWNLMRIEKDDKNALWVCQYAHRFYKIDEKAAQTINSERENLLGKFGALQFPK